ncbi:hypothetical protein D3C71_1494940 [compost metagenome]
MPITINNIDGIIISRRDADAGVFGAYGAGDEHLSVFKNLGDPSQRVRIFGQDERHRSLRPDHDIRAGFTVLERRCREAQMLLEDLRAVRIVQFLGLINHRLNNTYGCFFAVSRGEFFVCDI